MENRKRILAVLLAGTMIAGSLAGCGSNGGSDTIIMIQSRQEQRQQEMRQQQVERTQRLLY